MAATDSPELFEQIKSALLDNNTVISWAKSGQEAAEIIKGEAVGTDRQPVAAPDILVADLQIGNMGGVAVSYDLQLEILSGRVPDIPVILLLDREADVFLAKEVGANAYMVKPVDVLGLKRMTSEAFAARQRG